MNIFIQYVMKIVEIYAYMNNYRYNVYMTAVIGYFCDILMGQAPYITMNRINMVHRQNMILLNCEMLDLYYVHPERRF